ncbi:42534_t:CDS:2 [Gigaspora margarita]|uniref:42534_t:CDS:1 n=1 Tax=Gigaspora margarita TaxID=4874 RepID=A0ABN7V2Y2_GIGMA|nr:42534_t:CDS:2 [Gigaspora margarita]
MDEETIKKLKKEIKETIDEKDKVENDLLKIFKKQKEEIKAMNKLIVKLNAEKLEHIIKQKKKKLKSEERKIALEKLSHGYRELQETLDKINQEKFIEETKKYKVILKKVEESLNDYEEY